MQLCPVQKWLFMGFWDWAQYLRWLAVEAAPHAIALKSREWLAWVCEPLLLLCLSQGQRRERPCRARAGAAAHTSLTPG